MNRVARTRRERDLVHALNSPLRRRILTVLRRQGTSFPREIAGILDEPLPKVSYHVRVLADCGAVKLVDKRPARGALRHVYAFAVTDGWALDYLSEREDGTA